MIEMPRHEGNVKWEDAIRALELIWNYVAITGVAGKKRSARLYDLTSRSAIGWITNPPFTNPEQELLRQIPKVLKDLHARPSSSDTEKAGVANIRCTLEAYLKGER